MLFKRGRPYMEALAFKAEKDREYDEDEALTRYVWEYCTDRMTEIERRAGGAILARAKAETMDRPMRDEMMARWGALDDPEVEAALRDGPKAFRRKVKDRLLREHGDELFINRCPRCGRVVRTPKARLCLWCGHSWHHAENAPESGETIEDRG
jgi:uncharacterized C2H2 Zn-finger protein